MACCTGFTSGFKGLVAGLFFAGLGVVAATLIMTSAQADQQKSPAAPLPTATNPATKPAADTKSKPESDPETKPVEGVIRHGQKTPNPKPKGAIRVASYNIENLFDSEQAPTEPGRDPVPSKPAAHRKAAADAIRAIDADILALQEIESKDTLIKFRDEYLKDMGYDHVSSLDAGDGRGIEQSVLSRFPIKMEENWPKARLDIVEPAKIGKRDNPNVGKMMTMARSPLHAVIEVPKDKAGGERPYTLHLMVVHHKSGPYHSFQREAEAAQVAKTVAQLEKQDPAVNIVILGDCNAKSEEKALGVYYKAGMVDAFAGVDTKNATFQTHASDRAIDHILFNANAHREFLPETRFVLGVMQRRADQDWRRTPPPAGYASDHYPVVVDLTPIDK